MSSELYENATELHPFPKGEGRGEGEGNSREPTVLKQNLFRQ
jgi:hypothetical protein